MSTPTVILDGATLACEDVTRVAWDHAPVALHAAVHPRVDRARAVVERFEAENRPVYGLTRGLGPAVVTEVAEADRAAYSRVVVLARAVGAGPPFATDVVRAMLVARANGMAAGGSGVRPVIVDTLVAMLNAGVHPIVPSIGSVGASDLALMANLALPVLGEGRAEVGGEVLPGAEAIRRAAIPTVELASKEGLALCSASSVSAGQGALALCDLEELLLLLDATAALTFEAFRANVSPIDPRVVAARPAPGQAAAAARLRDLLAGGDLLEPGAARRVQDPISLRCVSHVHGALRAALDFARPHVEVELNAAADNPLVLADDGEILSNGNFQTPGLALAFDLLALAASQVAALSASRVSRLMANRLTDLPELLTRHGMPRAGLALVSLTARSLAQEIRFFAAPASTHDPGGIEVEDSAPMTPLAVRKLATALPHLQELCACELVVAAQALDLRAPARVSPVAAALHREIRARVAPLDDDRSMTPDLQAVALAVRDGDLSRAVRAAAMQPTNADN